MRKQRTRGVGLGPVDPVMLAFAGDPGTGSASGQAAAFGVAVAPAIALQDLAEEQALLFFAAHGFDHATRQDDAQQQLPDGGVRLADGRHHLGQGEVGDIRAAVFTGHADGQQTTACAVLQFLPGQQAFDVAALGVEFELRSQFFSDLHRLQVAADDMGRAGRWGDARGHNGAKWFGHGWILFLCCRSELARELYAAVSHSGLGHLNRGQARSHGGWLAFRPDNGHRRSCRTALPRS